MTVTYVIDGAEVTGLDRFWQVIGAAVNGPGGYFGSNLDALADCLHGGYGTPDDGDFVIEWRRRRNLAPGTRPGGDRAHAPAAAGARAPGQQGRHPGGVGRRPGGRGPTVFDELVQLIEEEAPGVLRLG